MDGFNLLIKRFSISNYTSFHWSLCRRSSSLAFFAFFAFPKFKDQLCLSFFNKKTRKQYSDYLRSQSIRCLIAVKRFFGIFTMLSFFIIISTKGLFKQFYSNFINHSYLYSFMIKTVDSIRTRLLFFNSNISFSVNQSGKVSNKFIFSHILHIPRMGG